MSTNERDNDKQRQKRGENGDTPGSIGYPEPGSGHDDSETVTVEDGPPIRKVDGEPGAHGDVETERQPARPDEAPRDVG